MFSSLFTDLPVDKFEIWSQVHDRLRWTPYIFDLGVLPQHGEGDEFRKRLVQLLTARRQQFPSLFPMRTRSGISMILFEDSQDTRDLDNLIRTVLPSILDILRPPSRDLPGWVASEPELKDIAPDIPFLEVAAVPADAADMPPGSVVFGLSSGTRFRSWWDSVEEHLERELEQPSGW